MKNWDMGEPELCWGVIVEAARGFRLYTTSILDVYNVFEHHDMQWMGIWVHPYTDTSAGGGEFEKIVGGGAQMMLGCHG